jgi:hypothetical protein
MKNSWGLLLCLVLLVMACKKETQQPPSSNQLIGSGDSSECLPIVRPDTTLSWLIGWSTYRKMMPYFNPNNNDEFLYIDRLPGSPFSDMCIYNLVTGESNCILSGQTYLYQPRWHANDWILFRGNGDNVFRIKSNGDSLLQITTSSVFQRPVWRPDGLAWISNNAVNFAGDIDVFDLEGNLIEVIPGEEFFIGDWSESNRIVTRSYDSGTYQFAWTDVENVSWQYLDFDTASPQNDVTDLKWIPLSDELIFSQLGSDISRINVLTGEKIRVREGCGTRYYHYFSINNNCSMIVAERVTPEEIYSDGWFNIVIYKSDIVIMNFDGTNEQVINLP